MRILRSRAARAYCFDSFDQLYCCRLVIRSNEWQTPRLGTLVGSFGNAAADSTSRRRKSLGASKRRVHTSAIWNWEIRHPSRQIVLKLSEALKLDPRDMFLLVNPGVNSIISEQQKSNATPAWNAFVKDAKARKIYKITDHEMEILSEVAKMGEVRDPRDFVFILIIIRQALGL